MATPAAVLSILVEANGAQATATLSKFDKQLGAADDAAKRGIEAKLGAALDPEAFDRYSDYLDRAAERSRNLEAFKAQLGANFNPRAFTEYQRALDKAAAATKAAQAKMDAGAGTGAAAGLGGAEATGAKAAAGAELTGAEAAAAGGAGVSASVDEAAGKSRELFAGMKSSADGALKSLGLVGVGVGAIGYESIKSLVTFQAQMERLQTQAGASSQQVKVLSGAVRNLAPSVGTGPVELAQGMYHVVSSLNATIPAAQRSSTELKVLRIAAEGAKVGGADLVDVTNALDAAIVSGISGVQNYSQAMGALNSVVGAGDMTMQDLADALGTGVLASAKLAGVSITSLGGALAVLGDNNIRGAHAGTLMTSALRIMKAPSDAAAKALGGIGLSSTSLAAALRSGGLVGALGELKQHLAESGDSVTGTAAEMDRAGLVLTRAFGGKQSTGISILLSQFDRLKEKTADTAHGAGGFGAAWTKTTHTLSFELDQVKADFDAVLLAIGGAMAPLVPVLDKAAGAMTRFVGQIKDGKGAGGEFAKIIRGIASVVVTVSKVFGGMGNMIKGVAIAFGILGAAIAATTIIEAVNPVLLIFMAVAAAAALIIDHWKVVGPFLAGVWNGIKSVAGPVIQWLVTAWGNASSAISAVAKAVFPTVEKIITVAFGAIKMAVTILKGAFVVAWDVIGGIVKTQIAIAKFWITKVLVPAFDFIKGPLIALGGLFLSVFNGIQKVVGSVITFVLGVLAKFLHVAAGVFSFLSHVPGVGHMFDGLAKGATAASNTINELRRQISAIPPKVATTVAVSVTAGTKGQSWQQAIAASTTGGTKGQSWQQAIASSLAHSANAQAVGAQVTAKIPSSTTATTAATAAATAAPAVKAATTAAAPAATSIPSQLVAAQTRMAQIANQLQVAQNAGNIAGQGVALLAERKLEQAWLSADRKQLDVVNKELANGHLSMAKHAQLLKDRLSLTQEIGNVLSSIGSATSSIAGLSSGSGSGSFDLAPSGGTVTVPTVYDIRQAVAAHRAGLHHQHTGDITVTNHFHVKDAANVAVMADKIERSVTSALKARMRSAGVRGT